MYGLESDLQDILLAHPELFSGGETWEPVTGRHAAGGGWVDLLFRVSRRHYAVVEVKRGQADLSAIDQVVNYAQDLRARYGGGHEGSSRKGGVNTLIVPLSSVRRVGPRGPAPGQMLNSVQHPPAASSV